MTQHKPQQTITQNSDAQNSNTQNSVTTVNPATGAALKRYPLMSDQVVDEILSCTVRAQTHWRHSSFVERSAVLIRLAETLEKNVESLSQLMCEEMGKPLAQARLEVAKCASCCRWVAEQGPQILQDRLIPTEAERSYVSFQPLGVILAVMPWNFPLWQVFRALAPAVMCGNGMVLKHASSTTGCALAIERFMHEAGAPTHLMRTLIVTHSQVERLIQDARVRGVTLTGSTPAGRKVAALSGQALKKTVLELGGSDGYVILKDVDVAHVARQCVDARLINAGQSCIAAKRFIIVKEIYKEFCAEFVAYMKSKIVGDPQDEKTQVGPMARFDLRDELHAQVQKSIEQGAKLLLGGELPERAGAFYPPTVLADVTPGQLAYREELFGPVASLICALDEDDAIAIANDTCFGLGAAVWTQDRIKGEHIAKNRLEAGCCFVNESVRSDARLPFGGVKDSGYGRELSSHGLYEFTNIKTVYVR